MRFLFFPYACIPFHAHSLDEKPMGDIETGILKLAETLDALGQEVIVLTALPNPPLSKPRYLPIQALDKIGSTDVLIIAKGWRGAFFPIPCQKCFAWIADGQNSPHTIGIGDRRVVMRLNGVFFTGKHQEASICESSGYPKEKSWILRFGVHLADFAGKEAKNRKRLICTSTDPKGLSALPIIFEKLKKKHSGLELHLFTNEAVLLPKMEGFFLHRVINQKQMAREWLKSSIFIYPIHDSDDSGVAAMEAQAGGCATVATYFEDLADIVGDAGLLIPQQSDYTDHFIEAVDRLLSDDAEYMRLCQNALKRRHELDWKCRGRELLRYLKEIHGME